MKGLGKTKIFRLGGNDDLQVEAYAPVVGGGEYRRIRFKATQVDYIYEIGEGLSGLALANGVAIPVALPFDDLKQRIYEPEASAPVADLTAVTGKAVEGVQAVRLSKDFNPAAGRKDAEGPAALAITVFAHQKRNDMAFRRVTFDESDMEFFEPHSDRKDSEIYIRLKRPAEGWSEFYAAIPITYFTSYLRAARQNGDATLDLTEFTRPKSTSSLRIG